MNDVVVLIAGLLCGFVSSSPLGTINLWLINQTLKTNKLNPWFISGVVVADCTYASLAAWGYQKLFSDTAAERWVGLIGGSFLIVLGLLSFRKGSSAVSAEKTSETMTKGQQWLLGAFMCGSNPAFFVFWVFAVNSLDRHLDLAIKGTSVLPLVVGIACGDVLWFSLLSSLVKRFRNKVTDKWSMLINRTVASIFVVVGLATIVKIV